MLFDPAQIVGNGGVDAGRRSSAGLPECRDSRDQGLGVSRTQEKRTSAVALASVGPARSIPVYCTYHWVVQAVWQSGVDFIAFRAIVEFDESEADGLLQLRTRETEKFRDTPAENDQGVVPRCVESLERFRQKTGRMNGTCKTDLMPEFYYRYVIVILVSFVSWMRRCWQNFRVLGRIFVAGQVRRSQSHLYK